MPTSKSAVFAAFDPWMTLRPKADGQIVADGAGLGLEGLGDTDQLAGARDDSITFDTQMQLLLLPELVSALRANDSDTFRRWLSGGIQDLGRSAVEELMLKWMNPLLTVEEMDRLVGWHLGISISLVANQMLRPDLRLMKSRRW